MEGLQKLAKKKCRNQERLSSGTSISGQPQFVLSMCAFTRFQCSTRCWPRLGDASHPTYKKTDSSSEKWGPDPHRASPTRAYPQKAGKRRRQAELPQERPLPPVVRRLGCSRFSLFLQNY